MLLLKGMQVATNKGYETSLLANEFRKRRAGSKTQPGVFMHGLEHDSSLSNEYMEGVSIVFVRPPFWFLFEGYQL